VRFASGNLALRKRKFPEKMRFGSLAARLDLIPQLHKAGGFALAHPGW